HLECLGDCLRTRFNIVWIHDDRVMQFSRGPGKATQNQYAPFIAPRRNILLCYQVHSVVQRGDHAQMCCSVIALHFFMIVLPVLEDDRLPPSALKARIDPFGFSSNLSLKFCIALDAAAGWRSDLDECKFPLI